MVNPVREKLLSSWLKATPVGGAFSNGVKLRAMLRQFLIRWLCNGLGLWIAASLLPGITYKDDAWVIVIAALIFSLINMLIRPVVIILSLPAIVLSLGLFTLVINTLMLLLVTKIYSSLEISSFGAGLLAIMIIWLVNYALNTILQPRQELIASA